MSYVANIIDVLRKYDKNEVKPQIEIGILKSIVDKYEDWGLGLITLINELNIGELFPEKLVQDLKTLANYGDEQ